VAPRRHAQELTQREIDLALGGRAIWTGMRSIHNGQQIKGLVPRFRWILTCGRRRILGGAAGVRSAASSLPSPPGLTSSSYVPQHCLCASTKLSWSSSSHVLFGKEGKVLSPLPPWSSLGSPCLPSHFSEVPLAFPLELRHATAARGTAIRHGHGCCVLLFRVLGSIVRWASSCVR
jgi:hypothetical protein